MGEKASGGEPKSVEASGGGLGGHELSLSDVVLLLAFGSVHEVDGLGQAFLE